jgi:hypothetical protein
MFRRKEKKIIINDDGDEMSPEQVDIVKDGVKDVAKEVMKLGKPGPFRLPNPKEPQPEDYLLLQLYQAGAISSDKAVLIKNTQKAITFLLLLFSDNFVEMFSERQAFVTALGVKRLRMLWGKSIDKKRETKQKMDRTGKGNR